jgi:hypothetical protein
MYVEGLNVYLHPLLISALDGSEWLISNDDDDDNKSSSSNNIHPVLYDINNTNHENFQVFQDVR